MAEPDVARFEALLTSRGRELPPNMLGFIESAGLAAVAYGPDSQAVERYRHGQFTRLDG